ncbi:MAG: putative dehydrogenase [Candidatus Omnitrophota bacterium]|jgi:predicted dehydrogenase
MNQDQGKKINVAVIGCGYWGPNLIRNFAESDSANLTHICDLDEAVLLKLKNRYPYVQTTADYQSLLQSPDIDGIVIATPVHTHFRIAKEALEAGKHVQIEKPLAATLEEGRILTQIAKDKNLVLLVDHTFIYSKPIQILKESMSDLGELRYFDSVRVNLGLFQNDINVIWDLAPHDISILLYLTGQEPEEVMAIGAAHIQPNIDNTAYVVAKYKNNFIAHFHFNWLSPVKIRQTLICGSKKMIAYNDLDPIEPVKIYDYGVEQSIDKSKIMVDYRTGDVLSPQVERIEALRNVCDDFVHCIQSGDSPKSNADFGVSVLKVLDAADQSLKNNSQFIKLG